MYNRLRTAVEEGGCTLSLGSDRSTQPYRVRITNEPVDPSSVLRYYYSLQRTKYEYGWANIRTPWCTRKQAISGLRRIRNCSPTMPDFEPKKVLLVWFLPLINGTQNQTKSHLATMTPLLSSSRGQSPATMEFDAKERPIASSTRLQAESVE